MYEFDAYAPGGSEEGYVPSARAIVTTGLYALTYGPTTLELFWDRTEQVDLAGYKIRRDGQFVGFSSGTSYVDTVPASDRTYLYDVIMVQRNAIQT